MSMNLYIKLLVLTVVVVILYYIITVFFTRVRNKIKKIKYQKLYDEVYSSSLRRIALESLNGRFHFFFDYGEYQMNIVELSSKAQFDKFSYLAGAYDYIKNNYEQYIEIVKKAEHNQEQNRKYLIELEKLPPCESKKNVKKRRISYKKYVKMEETIYKELLLEPVTNPVLEVYAKYTSPQGRNRYLDSMIFDIFQIKEILRKINENGAIEQTKEFERSLLTAGKRYEILRRDQFRCVICGRTTKDGIKLHVDHIIPVSKGGKTTDANLRTLCQDCNLGKSDKYDWNSKYN